MAVASDSSSGAAGGQGKAGKWRMKGRRLCAGCLVARPPWHVRPQALRRGGALAEHKSEKKHKKHKSEKKHKKHKSEKKHKKHKRHSDSD